MVSPAFRPCSLSERLGPRVSFNPVVREAQALEGSDMALLWILILLIVLYDLDRELDKYDRGG